MWRFHLKCKDPKINSCWLDSQLWTFDIPSCDQNKAMCYSHDITISIVMPILEHVNSTWLCFGIRFFIGWTNLPKILIIIERVISDILKVRYWVWLLGLLFWCAGQVLNFRMRRFEKNACEWDLLHGMSSNCPQTAGKRNLFMHICEGECCWIFF